MQNKLVLLTALCAGLMGYANTSQAAPETLAQTEIAAVPAVPMRMTVHGTCSSGTPTFFLLNRGQKWPRTALVKLFYADDNSAIGQRRVRLKSRQRISLSVKSGLSDNRPLGIWVDPSWYARSFAFDATLKCSSDPAS